MRRNDDKISVFITSYNQKAYLIEAIESVLNQTLKPFEIIIADDCSNDGSQELIAAYAEKFPNLIKPFFQKNNLGIPRNKSFALAQVRGDFVTYLDGDDRFLPNKLEMELKCLKDNPDTKIVFSNVYLTDSNGQRRGKWIENNILPPTGYVFHQVFGRYFPRRQLFRNEIVVYDCVKRVGFFDEEFAMYHDWDLRVRLTKHYKVAYCSDLLAEYRRHEAGVSKLPFDRHFDELQRVYAKNKHLLKDSSREEIKLVEDKLFAVLSYFGRNAIIDDLEKGNKSSAYNLYQNSKLYYSFWINIFLKLLFFFPHQSIYPFKKLFLEIRSFLPYPVSK